MRNCDKCGFENSNNMKFCGNCGAKLEMPKKTRLRDDDNIEGGISQSRKPQRKTQTNDSYTEAPKSNERASTHSSKKKRKSGDTLFVCIVLVLIVLVVLIGLAYVNRNYSGDTYKEKFMNMLNMSDPIITAPPTILPSKTDSGEEAIVITVYAKKGSVVIFREGATSMERTVEGSSISFRVPVSLWTENKGDELMTGVSISPNVFVYDPNRSNDIKKLEFEPYTVSVQSVDINLIKPEKLELVTANSSVKIEGTVSDPGVSLFMNGVQLQLDETGYFRTVYRVENYQDDNRVVFTAQDKNIATQVVGSTVLLVKYDRSKVDCTVYNESLRTLANTISVSGKIAANTDMTLSGVELEGDLRHDKNSGEFSFVAKVPQVGNYIITLEMMSADGSESSYDIYVEHAPDSDSYLRSSRAFEDYEYVKDHATMSKHYGITGSVVEVYQTEPYVKAKIHTSVGDCIFVYYDKTIEIAANDNKSYRMYCDVNGIDAESGLPVMYCWFIYKS